MNLPLQPHGVTLAPVSLEEAQAEVRLGQTVIVGEGERWVLRGPQRAVEGYAKTCTRFGWGLVTGERLARRGMPL